MTNTSGRYAQRGRRTTATGRVVDVDRQEAVFVIMSVKQRELLMAVDDIAGIIDVERDGCRSVGTQIAAGVRQPFAGQLECGTGPQVFAYAVES
jgi:hypothetical protein